MTEMDIDQKIEVHKSVIDFYGRVLNKILDIMQEKMVELKKLESIKKKNLRIVK